MAARRVPLFGVCSRLGKYCLGSTLLIGVVLSSSLVQDVSWSTAVAIPKELLCSFGATIRCCTPFRVHVPSCAATDRPRSCPSSVHHPLPVRRAAGVGEAREAREP